MGPLDDERFTHRVTKEGRVLVSFQGRPVVTVAGRDATRLIARLDAADARQTQLLLAKATRNFKHGNER